MHEMALEVLREVDAVLIPGGDKVKLQPGTLVRVTQALGNSYTVYVQGNLVRIAGKDGDALGLAILTDTDPNTLPGSLEDKIWAQLRTCFDPEIPVNIVDLGLVYGCNQYPLGLGEFKIEISMTLTAPACGMGPALVEEIKEKVYKLQEVRDVTVELVFEPPWTRERMSDEAKLQLGIL